ncbi:MAG: hypothetical protein II039_12670 [Treponema sp.]|nr:hypothetical protein [Treponema sp.]
MPSKSGCKEEDKIVKTALFSYAGSKEYFAYICKADFMPGSGDFEDEAAIANDKECDCFEIRLENIPGAKDCLASAGFAESLEQAIRKVEGLAGFVKWL